MHTPIPSRPRYRTAHLCDIENLAGVGRPTLVDLEYARSAYFAAVDPAPDDHLIVGCDRMSATNAGLAWGQSVRFVVGKGSDGADNALLSALPVGHAAARYDRIVIGSGDGRAFQPYALAARAAGLTVVVAALRRSCSRALLLAADAVIWLPDEPMMVAA